jgi:hypothetical protein
MIYGDDEVKPILWVPIIGPKSSGKTPAFRYAFAELRSLERDAFKAYRDELKEWKLADKGKGPQYRCGSSPNSPRTRAPRMGPRPGWDW